MAKMKIVHGKKNGDYKDLSLAELIGKKLEAIGETTMEQQFGDHKITVLMFEGGGMHGFVHPLDENE